jgi:hypothetical protein
MFSLLAKASIGSPMHMARLYPKRLRCGPAQARFDLLGATCGAHSGILLLALIGQAKAASARHATVHPIKHRNPPTTRLSFILARAIEPRPLAAEMALSPVDRDCLVRKFFDAVNENRMKNAENVKFGDQEDIIYRTIRGPKKGRGGGPQTILAPQYANINAPKVFTSCMLDHLTWTYRASSGTNLHIETGKKGLFKAPMVATEGHGAMINTPVFNFAW